MDNERCSTATQAAGGAEIRTDGGVGGTVGGVGNGAPPPARHRRRLILATAGALAISLLAVACGSSGATSNSPSAPPATDVPGRAIIGPQDSEAKAGGKIVFGVDGEPEALNPIRYAFSQSGNTVASAVFEPLATLNEKSEPVPYLATAFEASPDNRTWTVVLPTGVKFHDGTPFDAAALVADLEAYKSSPVSGALLYAVDSVTATDPTHVAVKLNRPMASFPTIFTTQIGFVFLPAMAGADPAAQAKPVGTGPFVFQEHQPGKRWTFTKNPTYRRVGLPHLDAIDFAVVIDPVDRNDQLRKGDLDVIETYGGAQVTELRSSGNKVVENHDDSIYLTLNTAKAPFDNVIARRAVARATDAAQWREIAGEGVSTPANSPFAEGKPGYLAENGYPTFDLNEAKKLVQQYETESGQKLEFNFVIADNTSSVGDGQRLAANYEAAGMKVTLVPTPQINQIAAVAVGASQLATFRLFNHPNPDADSVFYRKEAIGASISLNFPRSPTPEIDQAADAAIASTDDAVRRTAYEKINRILADQVPVVWLGRVTWVLGASPKVNGIYAARNGTIATLGAKTWIADISIDH